MRELNTQEVSQVSGGDLPFSLASTWAHLP